MTRQTFEFYKSRFKNANLETLQEILDNVEMPEQTKILLQETIARGMIIVARNAIVLWLYCSHEESI